MTDQQPPWLLTTPSGDGGPRPPHGSGRRAVLIVAAAVAVLLLAGLAVLGVGRYLRTADPGPTAPAPATPPATESLTEPTVEPSADPPGTEPAVPPQTEATADQERAALAQLERISAQDRTGVSFDGRLVAQLASKNPGISDPNQTAADGSHVFRATDILREFESLRDDPRNGDTAVLLLKSTDFGKRQLYNGRPLFVTFAVRPFPSRQAVLDWCARRFDDLSGATLANQCAVRRLQPPR